MFKNTMPLITMIALALVLAGCMGTPGDPETAREREGSAKDPAREETLQPEVPSGATIHLAADVTQGSIPLAVSFLLGSTGLDGFNLTWTLDATGDGQMDARGDDLPATVTHTYEEPGGFEATFTVQVAGQKTETSLTIQVAPLETWYLQWEQDDDDPTKCGEPSMKQNETGKAAGCNEEGVILSKVLSHLGEPAWATFPATDPTYGFPAGTPIEGVLHLASIGAGTGNLTLQLLADGAIVAQTITEVDDAPGIPEPGETTRNTTHPFDMKTEKRIEADAELSFRVAVNTGEHWHLRTSKESPSGFTIGGPYEHR